MYHKIDDTQENIDKRLSQKLAETIEQQFPIKGNLKTLRVKNVQVNSKYANMKELKEAILNGKSVFNDVKADVELVDNKTNKVIDRKRNMLIAKIPQFTKRGTFLVDGNSYVVPNQQRLKPGAYLFQRKNGEIVTIFNTQGNRQLKLTFDPTKGAFHFNIGNSNIPVGTILHSIGVTKEELAKVVGDKIANENFKTLDPTHLDKFISKSYKLPKEEENKEPEEKLKYLLNSMKVDPDVMERNFGVKSSNLDKNAILAAMKKTLGAYKSDDKEIDQKNNLANKKIYTVLQSYPEQFQKLFKKNEFKIKQKLNNPKVKTVGEVLSSSDVTNSAKMFLTTGKLARMPEEYNPVQIHMSSKLITPLGEGGIGSDRALTADDKSIHHSQLGFIDPVVSPEGSNTGIVLATTKNAYVDDSGEPGVKVLNLKTKKEEVVPVKKLWDAKVAYPATAQKTKEDGYRIRYKNKDLIQKTLNGVDYMLKDTSDMHSDSSLYLPLINSMDANRATMAQKHTQQAVSLKHRENPYVDTLVDNKQSISKKLAEDTHQVIKSEYDGVVSEITKDYIKIGTHKVDIPKDIPLARKTYIEYEPVVKVGQKIRKGQMIAESNYSKNGELATGTHLRTAWMSMPGNRNDAVIISETAAEKLTSKHMYKEVLNVQKDDILDLKKAKALFPMTLSKFDLSKYDSSGILKENVEVKKGEPLIIKLTPNQDKPLTKLEKTIFKPFKIKIETWNHSKPGEVISVKKRGSDIRMFIKTEAPATIGDKVSGRYGNKGSISKILPDDKMPKNKNGEPVHVVITSNGVISRTNPGQLIEGTLAKVTAKTGKKYVMPLYGNEDNLKFANQEAKKHKVETEETLINPETGKPFPEKVFVGNPYTYKLFKDSESGLSALSTDKVDVNQQPGKGGKTSASSFSNMEVNALLAHNAKDFLREARNIKGQKNDEWFEAFRTGAPLPKPAENYSYEKFKALLNQLNVNVHDTPDGFNLVPMNPKDVIKKGKKEVKSSETINGNDGSPRKNGLFDPKTFGELGNRYAHIKLSEPIINPMYTYEVSRLVGIPEKNLEKEMLSKDGMNQIIDKLKSIDANKEISKLKKESKESNNDSLKDRNLKVIKFLEKTKQNKQKLTDVVTMKNVLVIPPIYRPIIKDHSGSFGVSDLNLHYQELINVNNSLKEAKKNKLSKDSINKLKKELYDSVSGLYGLKPSSNKQLAQKNVKGVLNILGGDRPKESLVHKALLRKNQFMSGRGVMIPSRGDLKLDEVEIPEEMGLKMYEPHISRELAKMGYSKLQINEMIENKDPRVIQTLHRIGKQIPVVYNRAPSLWRHNLIGAYPKFTHGKAISVPPMVERALAGDYDGDQIGVHVPVTQKGIEDVKKNIMASKQLFTEQGSLANKDLLMITDQDAILGAYKASIPSKKHTTRVRSVAELKKLIEEGKLNYNDKVTIG